MSRNSASRRSRESNRRTFLRRAAHPGALRARLLSAARLELAELRELADRRRQGRNTTGHRRCGSKRSGNTGAADGSRHSRCARRLSSRDGGSKSARAILEATMVDYDETPLRLFHVRLLSRASEECSATDSASYSSASRWATLAPIGSGPRWMGLLGGTSLLGLFAGSLLTGPAADRFARRPYTPITWRCSGTLPAAGLHSLRRRTPRTAPRDRIFARHRLRCQQGAVDRIHPPAPARSRARVSFHRVGGWIRGRLLVAFALGDGHAASTRELALDAARERRPVPARAAAAVGDARVALVAGDSRPEHGCRARCPRCARRRYRPSRRSGADAGGSRPLATAFLAVLGGDAPWLPARSSLARSFAMGTLRSGR